MTTALEQALGLKIGRDESKLWGTGEGEDPQKVRLVSLPSEGKRGDNFNKVTRAVDPPHLKNGGCVLEDDLITPNGERFAVLTFHGDVAGWQRQIEDGAALLGLKSAKIVGDALVVSDGQSFPVVDCKLDPSSVR